MYIIPKAEERRFEFELDGDVYSVPSIATLPLSLAEEVEGVTAQGGLAVSKWVRARIFEPACEGIGDKLTAAQWTALVDAWAAEGGASLGE